MADLGYVVHSPASVFGKERLDEGLQDEDWLPVVGAKGWVVFGRDRNILERELELRAYLEARVHMFLLPGSITRDHILELLAANLADICALASARQPGVYWLTASGVVDLPRRRARRQGRR